MTLIVRAPLSGADDTMIERISAELRAAGATEVVALSLGEVPVLVAQGIGLDSCPRVRELDPAIDITEVSKGAPLVNRNDFDGTTRVEVGSVDIGGPEFTVIAGPCAVESYELVEEAARCVKEQGATVLRGGAYKPRTSPYSFQGMGLKGLELLCQVGLETGMPVVSEVVDPREVELFHGRIDMLQVGTRNAQNFALLREVGRSGLPVLLKRGFGCTVDEWLHTAEYIVSEGNPSVVLCERGIRTFETSSRFTIDLASVILVKRQSHLPVVVDPSHGCGDRGLVLQLALAAAAAGADGLIVDVHPNRTLAKCDGDQALDGGEFATLMQRLRPVATAVERPVREPVTVPSA